MPRRTKPVESDKQYEVRMRCVVIKIVTCEDCTEDQAAADPFKYAVSEFEADQVDWEVVSVQEMI